MSLPWWAIVLIVFAGFAVLSPVLAIICPPIGKLLGFLMHELLTGMKWLFKGLWWLICLPFRGIATLIRRRKNKDEDRLAEIPPDKTGNIYKTTDGFLENNPKLKKERRLAVIEQRKDDGALAGVKIYSLDGKEEKFKEGKNYIPDLVLTPEEHSSLTEDSIASRKVVVGVKRGERIESIFPADLENTGDKLTEKELKIIQDEVQNDCPKNRKHHEKKMKKWRNHFKEE